MLRLTEGNAKMCGAMDPDEETDDERAQRLELESTCASIGRALFEVMPPSTGFALLMFDFGEKGSFAYVSTGQREDLIRMLGVAQQKLRSDG